MDNRSLYLTLAVSAGLAFLITLIIYASISGRNPLSRVGYGILVSLVPALGVIAVIKITRLLVSRVGAVFIYTILFVLVLLLQAVGRLIPVYT